MKTPYLQQSHKLVDGLHIIWKLSDQVVSENLPRSTFHLVVFLLSSFPDGYDVVDFIHLLPDELSICQLIDKHSGQCALSQFTTVMNALQG